MKYTPSQITRLVTTGGLRPMAYKRLPESRWLVPVAVFLICLAVMIVLGLGGIQ